MRGSKKISKRQIKSDPKYNSITVAEFVNKLMTRGKKETAQLLIYRTFEVIREKTKKDPIEVFEQAIKNTAPLLEVRSRRIGGATYQVPLEVRPDRRTTLAMRWIINSARAKTGQPFDKLLANEIINAYNGIGDAIKKREDTHKMAEANRAFAHFARF